MKRSRINAILREAIDFFRAWRFALPGFAYYSPEEFRARRANLDEVVDAALGWDVTTFGGGDFDHTGLTLFTLRNGRLNDPRYPKPYAEKIMMVREGQITPRHFHWHKREDIINRGGGNLLIELFHADPAGNRLADEPTFAVSVDGERRTMRSGEVLRLEPGMSVCLESIHAHRFYGEAGHGPVLVGEVSAVNDDTRDNCFLDTQGRFDPVEEDEPPLHLLAADYATLG